MHLHTSLQYILVTCFPTEQFCTSPHNLPSLKLSNVFTYSKAMESVDANAIWMMQGWLFTYGGFWHEAQIKAILSSVPKGKMLLLDLDSTHNEVYSQTESFYGLQPFIFNDLSNFGGSLGLYGRFDNINNRPFEARQMNGSTMVGTGFTPEGKLYTSNFLFYMFRFWQIFF